MFSVMGKHNFISDDDECAGGLCPSNSDCENTFGSYDCYCHVGFKHPANGNKRQCDGMHHVQWFVSFFMLSMHSKCIFEYLEYL